MKQTSNIYQNNALNELEKRKEVELDAAYRAASKDASREMEAKEWGECDVEKVEGWEWYDIA